MGSKERQKGNRVERMIVNLHKAMGIGAVERVPLSGQLENHKGDVLILDFVGEVKARKSDSGFKKILDWLGNNSFLFVVQDRKEPFVVMTWETYKKLIKAYNKQLQQ